MLKTNNYPPAVFLIPAISAFAPVMISFVTLVLKIILSGSIQTPHMPMPVSPGRRLS
jgi:hypothetical protein